MRRLALAFVFVVAAAGAHAEAPQPSVVMYATDWCGYCAKARAYFAKNGIAYVERDVEKSAQAAAEFRRQGGRGVPLIFVGRERLDGFNELAFEFAHARAAR
ncbi:MAG: glutaredoxin family protein [Burkholderiales bacterium]